MLSRPLPSRRDCLVVTVARYPLTSKKQETHMMSWPKVIALIPAYNEEQMIGKAIDSVSKYVDAVIVVDDGSTDETGKIAEKRGVLVVHHDTNQGLGRAIRDGMKAAVIAGSDIIVIFDADLQYDACEIPQLVSPIRKGEADLVLGSRLSGQIEYMPIVKLWGNRIFTKITGWLAGVPVTDAQTGFRAFTKNVAVNLNISSSYTYTQEMIIRSAKKGFRIKEIPTVFRKRISGRSRLISSPLRYGANALLIVVRTYGSFHPLRFLGIIDGFRIIALGLASEVLSCLWSVFHKKKESVSVSIPV